MLWISQCLHVCFRIQCHNSLFLLQVIFRDLKSSAAKNTVKVCKDCGENMRLVTLVAHSTYAIRRGDLCVPLFSFFTVKTGRTVNNRSIHISLRVLFGKIALFFFFQEKLHQYSSRNRLKRHRRRSAEIHFFMLDLSANTLFDSICIYGNGKLKNDESRLRCNSVFRRKTFWS